MSRLGQTSCLSSPFQFIKFDSDPNVRQFILSYWQCRETATERDAVIDAVWFDFVAFYDCRTSSSSCAGSLLCWNNDFCLTAKAHPQCAVVVQFFSETYDVVESVNLPGTGWGPTTMARTTTARTLPLKCTWYTRSWLVWGLPMRRCYCCECWTHTETLSTLHMPIDCCIKGVRPQGVDVAVRNIASVDDACLKTDGALREQW